MDEEANIFLYLAAVKKLWETDPAQAHSLEVFLTWEQEYNHSPFLIPSDSTTILQGQCSLIGDKHRIACCVWDFTEEAPVLRVEGDTSIQRFRIVFDDGYPIFEELDLLYVTEDALSYGEKLEVIYDVVNYLRQHRPQLDVRSLSLADYREALEALAPAYESRTILIMHRETRPHVRAFVRTAVEDMAADEISNQLILPLDGTYALSRDVIKAPHSTHSAFVLLQPQTGWRVLQELEFLAEAFRYRAKLREDFVLQFDQAKVLEENERRGLVLKLSLGTDAPVGGGDRLLVYNRGERAPIGLLTLDLDEGQYMIGTLKWNDYSARDSIHDPEIYARPQRGPESFASSMFDALVVNFKDKGTFESPALCSAFGVERTRYTHHGPPDVCVADLDSSQAQAWKNAVDDENPLVVIQGPPGTGKTHVLVRLIRELVASGQRILVTGPSNVSVDNVCTRILDLPLLRIGKQRDSINEIVSKNSWMYNIEAVREFQRKNKDQKASVYAGTHIGILKEELISIDAEKNGIFDAIIFDEAGMANLGEFALCAKLARRAILFGDHQQLPPFPLPREVEDHLRGFRVADRAVWSGIQLSALQWLIDRRGLPVNLLRTSYRCQNPRLMRFASTLFYNARVRASAQAEYYTLPFDERLKVYPPNSLRIFSTSRLPLPLRKETLLISGNRPGLENGLEARVVIALFYSLLRRYPIEEITVITPYRRQARLIRKSLSLAAARGIKPDLTLKPDEWDGFLRRHIATVDSFQGGESDVVIISYVRSNDGGGIGFVDDPHRINVAHTRCRRELIIVADIDCLAAQARNNIPRRLRRAILRDGEISDVPPGFAEE